MQIGSYFLSFHPHPSSSHPSSSHPPLLGFPQFEASPLPEELKSKSDRNPSFLFSTSGWTLYSVREVVSSSSSIIHTNKSSLSEESSLLVSPSSPVIHTNKSSSSEESSLLASVSSPSSPVFASSAPFLLIRASLTLFFFLFLTFFFLQAFLFLIFCVVASMVGEFVGSNPPPKFARGTSFLLARASLTWFNFLLLLLFSLQTSFVLFCTVGALGGESVGSHPPDQSSPHDPHSHLDDFALDDLPPHRRFTVPSHRLASSSFQRDAVELSLR
mmetsp:Transcript_4831/g.8300  ORF Transcript_4831/g.8300 Transcript_4831/m.8300 type:complete len:272 (+) Transcript_4831:229-1044(+)